MNRSELTAAISERSDLSHRDVERVLDALEQVMLDVASEQGTLTLPGLLSLDVTERAARTGRNPQTGETMEIAAARTARLRPGARLKRAARG